MVIGIALSIKFIAYVPLSHSSPHFAHHHHLWVFDLRPLHDVDEKKLGDIFMNDAAFHSKRFYKVTLCWSETVNISWNIWPFPNTNIILKSAYIILETDAFNVEELLARPVFVSYCKKKNDGLIRSWSYTFTDIKAV